MKKDMFKYWPVSQDKTKKESLFQLFKSTSLLRISRWGRPCGVVVKVIERGIVVSEFELQSRYYVYLRTNTLPNYGLNNTTME